MTTRTITGNIRNLQEEAWTAGATVRFVLEKGTFTSTHHTPPSTVPATIDEDGAISVELHVPARYRVILPNGYSFQIVVVEGAATTLEALHASTDTTLPPTNALQTAIEAVLAATPLNGLGDVNAPSPDDGDVPTWDEETGQWVARPAGAGGGGASDINELDAEDFTLGQSPKWDGDSFVPETYATAAALASEGSARASADSALNSAISSEASTRGSADTALTNAINAEATTRQAIDNVLGDDITVVSDALAAHTNNTSNPHSVTKSQVGLGNVTNADHAAALATHTGNTSNPHSVTKAQVGLGNVTDVDHAAALATHTGNTSNPHSVTKAQVGLGNVTNVDHAAALATHTGNTSNPHSVTAVQVGLAPTPITLTDGATVTWDWSNLPASTATLTIGGNRTLALSNVPSNFAVGTLVLTQDGTGSRTLALPAGHKVVNGGAGVLGLSTAGGSVDVLVVQKIGSTYYWAVGKNYTAA